MTTNQKVNKEAVRMLVADVGYTEASNQLGIDRNTLYQWNRRYGWDKPIVHTTQKELVRNVRSPGDAQAAVLAEMESETRISLAKYSRNAAGAIHKSVHPAKWTKEAHDIAKTASLVHGWGNDQGQAQFSLNVLNLGGSVQIGVRSDQATE